MSDPTLEELEASLNPKQCQFAREYVVDFCGAQAAIRAGYSKKTANVKASQLLALVKLAPLVAFHVKRTARATDSHAERVRLELARIGFGDVRRIVDCFDEDGRLVYKDLEDLSDDAAAALSAHLFRGKLQALTKLGEMDALFTQKVAFEGSEDGALTVVLKTAAKE